MQQKLTNQPQSDQKNENKARLPVPSKETVGISSEIEWSGGLPGAQESCSIGSQAAMLADRRFQTAQRQAVATEIGQVQGNTHLWKVVGKVPAQFVPIHQALPPGRVARLVPYNVETTEGRRTDPEQASGVLPFAEGGWDGAAIGRALTQLSPVAPRNADQRCIETSFLVALVQQGPGAVRNMIENYLSRYRLGLSQAATPERIKRWYRRSIRNLSPLLGRIDDQTLSYEDLSTLLTEMYDVYGIPEGGTPRVVEESMLRREGYQAQRLNLINVTQDQAAAEAQALLPGEFLSCAVEATREGTGMVDHTIQIGRHPVTGNLYLYDPWPVAGDQMIECSEDLSEIQHYFLNPAEAEEGTEEAGGEGEEEAEEGATFEMFTPRTFVIRDKYSPPPEEEAEE
jgi:hypothetical protein